MLTAASCMFHLHQVTLLWHGMIYSHVWPVQSWMSTNKLKLNPDKIEFLLVGKEPQRSKFLSMFPIELFNVKSNAAKSAWNLGIIFDKSFTFHSHVSAVCSLCFYHIWDLWCICCHLDLDSAKLLATALASSSLNYCNSRLYGITDTDLTNLQHFQNRLALILTKSHLTRSVPLLRSLHCLSVKFKILFKISLLTYKILPEKQSLYFHSMLSPSLPSLSQRSSKRINLSVPRIKTNTGSTAFHSCDPSVWKNLLLSVCSAISVATCKKHLKTHLFDLAFPP